MDLSRSKYKQRLQYRKRIFLSLAFVVLILLTGICYERIGEYNDTKNFPPVGKMVEVNNHKINVFSNGEGKTTVVFTGGWDEASTYAK